MAISLAQALHNYFVNSGIQGVMKSTKISTLKLLKELKSLNIVPANNSHTKVYELWSRSTALEDPPTFLLRDLTMTPGGRIEAEIAGLMAAR